MSTKPIFRMTLGDRTVAAAILIGKPVELVWSPMRKAEGEETFRGMLVAVAQTPGPAGMVAVLLKPGMVVSRAIPLSQTRSITEVARWTAAPSTRTLPTIGRGNESPTIS